MATKFITPSWRMPKNSNQSKASNYSLDFDTTDTIVPTNAPSINLSSHTISVWVKPNSSAFSKGISNIHCNQRLWYLSILANETGVRYQISTPLDSTTAVSTTEWTHIVASHDTDTNIWKIFQNGVLTATQTVNVTIGSWGGTNNKIGSSFDGKMANFAMFDYALSSNATTVGDIASGAVGALYNGGIPANPLVVATPPAVFYDLGQGSAYAEGSAGIVEPNLAAAIGSTVFEFDRSNSEYIDLNPGVMKDFTSDNISISAWVKANTLNVYDYIFVDGATSNNRIVALNYASVRGGLEFGVGNGSVARASGVSINTGEWYHIVCTYAAGGDLKFYLNGNTTPVATATFSGALDLSSHTKSSIGGSAVHSANYWDGEISNVQVWNAELGTSDVTTLYNNGTPLQSNIPQSGSLKAWYKLGLGTSVYDTTNTRWAIEDSSTPYNGTINFQI